MVRIPAATAAAKARSTRKCNTKDEYRTVVESPQHVVYLIERIVGPLVDGSSPLGRALAYRTALGRGRCSPWP
jgi:hypothetical protein